MATMLADLIRDQNSLNGFVELETTWPTATFFNRIRISVIKIGHKWKSINQVMFIWDRKKQHHVCQQIRYPDCSKAVTFVISYLLDQNFYKRENRRKL
ncbi:hypothetical protein DERP_001370 [Dermatophagoides pteronyssinus]|uniref:Uncharacterized protein n=1 Tax=Dermatophagoides pteronyssinus TaxID=6956 RepID=A0ABQ8JES7_DERPT|nr:hypothetical protein DERP_001370 [Dermatophagoides pteronyssinus]